MRYHIAYTVRLSVSQITRLAVEFPELTRGSDADREKAVHRLFADYGTTGVNDILARL